jgi:hypothetical protein
MLQSLREHLADTGGQVVQDVVGDEAVVELVARPGAGVDPEAAGGEPFQVEASPDAFAMLVPAIVDLEPGHVRHHRHGQVCDTLTRARDGKSTARHVE